MIELAPENDRGPRDLMMRLDGAAGVPILLKQDWELVAPPPDAIWKDACEAALEFAATRRLGRGAEAFSGLGRRVARRARGLEKRRDPGRQSGAVSVASDAWHRYAALAGEDLDDAVEAEALAQLLSTAEHPVIPEIAQTYTVLDSERVLERLLSERHVDRIAGDLSSLGSEESPAPKAAFWLLDRALPRSSEGLTFDQVPSVLGELYLFGRETDREARLEFVTTKTPDLDAKTERVRQLLAEFGGEVQKEETIREVSASSAALDLAVADAQ